MSDEVPLVWTNKGNLPIADLSYETEWQDYPEQTLFIEMYKLGDEVVKRSVHVMIKKGISVFGEQGAFSG